MFKVIMNERSLFKVEGSKFEIFFLTRYKYSCCIWFSIELRARLTLMPTIMNCTFDFITLKLFCFKFFTLIFCIKWSNKAIKMFSLFFQCFFSCWRNCFTEFFNFYTELVFLIFLLSSRFPAVFWPPWRLAARLDRNVSAAAWTAAGFRRLSGLMWRMNMVS